MLIIVYITHTYALDTEIELMQREGLAKHDISVYVEERVEYIHSRIALKPLITGIEHATKLSNLFEQKVNTTLGKILSNRISKLTHKMESKIENMYIRKNKSPHRVKRSFEFVGNLISKLFGNPGPEDWKQNKKNVIAMKEAIERQMANSVIQHHDIDQNRNAINMQNEILRQTTNAVLKNENRLNLISSALTEFETYIELEMMFDAIFEILDALKDIKHDSKTGRCNINGMNKEFLIEHLHSIESNKNGIAPVFASWEWHSYYNYEMCAVAVKDDAVWITLRIPIINVAEKMIRTIPSSSQLWIRQNLLNYGLESMLFKVELADMFMIVTKSNFDVCSVLGTTRVCNIRKTRFRQSTNYVVPVDIGHNRILIITNNTYNFSVTTICRNTQKTEIVNGNSMLRIPVDCAALSKSFEIGRKEKNTDLETSNSFAQIESATFHKLDNAHTFIPMAKKLQSNNTNFEKNNNETANRLSMISYNVHWSSEPWFITTTGSISTVVIVSIILLAACRCIKMSSARQVQIDLVDKCVDKSTLKNSIESHKDDCSCKNNEEGNLIDSASLERIEICEEKKNESTKRPMCQFRRLNN